ncbi:F-box-like/WD repeat-containing protein TBL1X [Daphnia pulex]|uniref:F-box-like/WD repeat-containing protein TBL1X n=1 Tax=Daphnia pulex TaxID=6669 RepID=UPI001EE147D8|nr:F-box-like/WD repeat-containing protein TBL1X [Daphnia pulex]
MTDAVNSPGKGFFKPVEFSITSKLDVRSSSFHPIDPVLACGLVQGGLVFLRGTNHSTPFENWEIEPVYSRYERTILSVQWNVNGTKVAAGSDNGTVIIVSYPGCGKQTFRRNGRSNFPLIFWHPFNRDMLASYNSALDTNEVMIANSAAENLLTHTIKSKWNCQTLAWNSHNQLAFGYDDGTFEIHEIELNNSQMKSRMVQKIRHDLGDHDKAVHHFSLMNSRDNFSLMNYQGQTRTFVSSIAINKEFELLASGGTDFRVKIWSLGSKDPILVLDVDSNCRNLVWNSGIKEEMTTKTFIACGLESGNVVIWYPFDHEIQTRKLTGHDQIHQLILSPDGRYLATTDYYKKVIIWSTKSWKSIYIIPSSEYMYPYMMTWDAASCKLAISERTGQRQFKVIEYFVAENCCAGCKKMSQNLKRCARCNSIFYCSKDCQRSHWPQHKLVCNQNE